MRKKFSIADKRTMLAEFEAGKPAVAFVNEHSCDIRTIQKALDDARRERDATGARSELMKKALFNHQKRLEDEMKRIVTILEVPEVRFTPLSWYEDDDSIFKTVGKAADNGSTLGLTKNPGRPSSASTTTTDLLRQHLKSDPLWKLLVQNDKAYAGHISNRIALQSGVVYLLEKNTGYKMSLKSESNLPFLYSYTVGPAVYESCLRVTLEGKEKEEFENELIADTRTGAVKFRNSILVENPGNEENCRLNILNAYHELLESPQLGEVKKSHENLSECYAKVKQAYEEIILLGYIPGSCSSCRRLGM
jgi:hypothetical protein